MVPACNPLADDLDEILASTGSAFWEPLRGANVFVTGGTGFFGRWLLESFAHVNARLALDARLFVLSRSPERFQAAAQTLAGDRSIAFLKGDIRALDFAQMRAQLGPGAPERFEFFIHAATETSTLLGADDSLRMAETIAAGTRNALEFALATGTRRFLFTSSGAIYGRQPADVTHVSESCIFAPDCTSPNAAYGEGKRFAELLCACFNGRGGLQTLIARPFAFAGPHMPLDSHFAVGNFFADAFRGGPIEVRGDGTPLRSYLYASDLTVALWTVLLRGEPCRAYNIGAEQAISVAELARAVADAFRPAPQVRIARAAQAGVPPARYVPSTARLRGELAFVARVGLAEAIRRTKLWHERAGNPPLPEGAREER